jgi:hypothetical protein
MPVMPDAALFARVHMIKLTQQREIAPYKWGHPEVRKSRR